MPIYRIQAPDGNIYRVQGPDGASNDQVVAALLQQNPDAGEAPGVLTEMGRGVVRGAGNVIAGFATPIEDTFGKNQTSDWLREAGKDVSGYVAPRATPGLEQSWEQEGVLGALKSAAVTVSEGSLPTLGGLLTAFLTKNPAASMAVMGITSAPQTYTGIRERQEEEGDVSKTRAVVGTAASTALDIFTGGGRAVSNVGREAILDAFAGGVRKAAKEVAKTGVAESGTEVIQSVIEQVAGGSDPTTKQAMMQSLEAGVAGLVGGTVFGGASEGINSYIANRYRKVAADVPPLHSVDIARPVAGAADQTVERIDIISAPTEGGGVIARTSDGGVFHTTLGALENMRVPSEGDNAASLNDILKAAIGERADNTVSPTPSVIDDAVARVVSSPEDRAALEEIVKRYSTVYGIPEEQARQLALGAQRTQASPAVPEAPTVPEEPTTPIVQQMPPAVQEVAPSAPVTAPAPIDVPVGNAPTAVPEIIVAEPKATVPEPVVAPEPEPEPVVAPEPEPEPVVAPEPTDVSLAEEEMVPQVATLEEAPVPVTKVAPGVARGVKPVQRGSQGTQQGRPVEGAAQLTEGMKAQQALMVDLQAAHAAREVTNAEVAEATNYLRPPTSEQELKNLPAERRNQWLEAIRLQQEVDTLQERVNALPKEVLGRPNPERVDLEGSLSGLQERLDQSQQDIVNFARDTFEKARTGRVEKQRALRRLLKDGNLPEALARETRIALRETQISRQEDQLLPTSTPEDAAFVQENIEGKSFAGALDWAIENAPSAPYRVIAQSVRRAMGTLTRAGWSFDLKVAHDGTMVPRSLLNSLGIAQMDYRARKATVWLNGTDINNRVGTRYETLLHEMVHAVTVGLVEASNRKMFAGTQVAEASADLYKLFNTVVQHFNSRVRSGDKLSNFEEAIYRRGRNALANPHEMLAWTLSNNEAMEYLDSIPYTAKQSVFQRLVEVVRNMLGLAKNNNSALAELLRVGDTLFETPLSEAKLVFDEYSSRLPPHQVKQVEEAKAAAKKMNKGLFKAQQASKASGFLEGLDEAADGAKLEGKVKRKAAIEAMSSTGAIAGAQFLPTSWIRDSIKKARPALGSILEGIDKLDQNLRGMRASIQRAMRRRVQEFERFTDKYGQDALSQSMTLNRVNRFDPTIYGTREEALQKDRALQAHTKKGNAKGAKARTEEINTSWDAWERLGKQDQGRETYKSVRQFYKDMYSALRAAQDNDIRALGLDPAATERLIRAAHGDLDEDAVIDEGPHTGLRENMFPQEYFPFRRFGDYALLVKRGKRAERERYHFETEKERNLFEARRAKELGLTRGSDEYNEAFTRLNGLQDMRSNMTEESFLLSKLFAAVDDIKEPTKGTEENTGKFKKDLKDRLYQTYLMTLPERNLRKQFIHAELVTGQSADALRVFKVAASQYASQLPKVLYGNQIQTQIEAAYDTANEGDPAEKAKLRSLLNIYAGRVRDTMDPAKQGALEQRVNEFTFLSLMTSVASALVQPLTLPFQVMPRMASRYGARQTISKVSAYIPLMSIVETVQETDPATGEKWFVAPTLRNVGFIKDNPLRARLWNELDVKRDLFSQKHADMLLRNRPSRKTKSDTVASRALAGYENMVNLSGALFSSADQITREMSGMAYAELEYEKLRKDGKTHEEAIEGAVEAAVRNTNETVGNYTELEKPDIFRGNMLKRMIGFLRTYSVQRTAYYFRMLGAITKGDPTQTRVQAASELSMVLAFTAMGAGISANFGYSFICNVIDLILAATMSDEEKDEWRRRDPLGADDADYRFRFEWLPRNFGADSTLTKVLQRGALSTLTGWDFSTRLSQNDMWLRDFKGGDTLRDDIMGFLTANLAPQVSQSANIIDGIDEFMNGNWSKGFGKLMPAAVRGIFNAERFATEGETTKAGRITMGAGEFSAPMLVGQALGFAPTELSRKREINRTTQAYQRAMTEERGKLFEAYRKALADDNSTAADIDEVLTKVRRYNSKVPTTSSGTPIAKYVIEPKDLIQSLRSTGLRTSKSYRGVEYAPGEGGSYFPYEPREAVRP